MSSTRKSIKWQYADEIWEHNMSSSVQPGIQTLVYLVLSQFGTPYFILDYPAHTEKFIAILTQTSCTRCGPYYAFLHVLINQQREVSKHKLSVLYAPEQTQSQRSLPVCSKWLCECHIAASASRSVVHSLLPLRSTVAVAPCMLFDFRDN